MVSAEPIQGTSHKIIHKLKNERGTSRINVGEAERLISIAVGIPMTIFGLNREILKASTNTAWRQPDPSWSNRPQLSIPDTWREHG